MSLRKMMEKLSLPGKIFLALAVIVLVLNLGIRLAQARQASEEDTWETRGRQARIALDRAIEESNLAALQSRKGVLEAALSESSFGTGDVTEVTLKLWGWAASSGLELRGLNLDSGTTKIGDTDLRTYKFSLSGQGPPSGVHRFLADATRSPYAPLLDKLTLKRIEGNLGWEFTMELMVYSAVQ